MTDKEVMQMALETAEQIASADYRHWGELASLGEFERWARSRANHIAEALRARLAQPENDFNPDWDAMAVMVEEQQRMAKRIEELEGQLAEQEPVAYLCENAVGHKYFRWKKPSSEYKPIALYTAHASPQRIWQGLTEEERLEILGVGGEAAVLYVTEAKLREKNG